MRAIDETHDTKLKSFVAGAESSEFPIQNLPFGVFDAGDGPRCGVAIGDQIFDLAKAAERSLLGVAGDVVPFERARDLNPLMAAGSDTSKALRERLVALLRTGADQASKVRECLVPMKSAQLLLPARVGDYTDFYTSVHHATNIGSLFRPNNPLLPNYKWIPIGYHGRSSSVVVSGTPVRRPMGQKRPAEGEPPPFGVSSRMDYELELGVMIGRGNALGDRIAIEDAEDHAFGVCLLNDWSARDLQAWEYQPLGPFLGKNFATSISPWIVTMEALAPFRGPFSRDAADPQPLAYLTSDDNSSQGALHIELSVELITPRMQAEGDAPLTLCKSDYRHAYWTLAQMITHHSVGGCNLRPGDLLGTGTLSGPDAGSEGALIETTRAGKQPLALPNGEVRTFLEDGDEVILKGRCVREGFASIGLGEVRGTIAAAR